GRKRALCADAQRLFFQTSPRHRERNAGGSSLEPFKALSASGWNALHAGDERARNPVRGPDHLRSGHALPRTRRAVDTAGDQGRAALPEGDFGSGLPLSAITPLGDVGYYLLIRCSGADGHAHTFLSDSPPSGRVDDLPLRRFTSGDHDWVSAFLRELSCQESSEY